jgi:Na+/H+ antiporter NhaC
MSYERKMKNLLFVLVFFLVMFLMVGYGQLSINESRKSQRIDQVHEKPIKYKSIVYKFKPIQLIERII